MDYLGDLGSFYGLSGTSSTVGDIKSVKHTTDDKAGKDLDMTDYLTLMVTMLQNQTMDSTVDTGQMMSQMVQMSTVEAINSISTIIQDATTLTYAAGLVGKTVTIGTYDDTGIVEKFEGQVTGTALMGGEQVVFVNGKPYALSSILGIGQVPDQEELEEGRNDEAAQAAEAVTA